MQAYVVYEGKGLAAFDVYVLAIERVLEQLDYILKPFVHVRRVLLSRAV
jgi:hypothetical protein